MKKYNDSPRAQANRAMSGNPYKPRRRKSPRSETAPKNRPNSRRNSKNDRKREYGQDLQSDRWKEKRDRIIKKAGGKCRFCGKPAKHVHHETYKLSRLHQTRKNLNG